MVGVITYGLGSCGRLPRMNDFHWAPEKARLREERQRQPNSQVKKRGEKEKHHSSSSGQPSSPQFLSFLEIFPMAHSWAWFPESPLHLTMIFLSLPEARSIWFLLLATKATLKNSHSPFWALVCCGWKIKVVMLSHWIIARTKWIF